MRPTSIVLSVLTAAMALGGCEKFTMFKGSSASDEPAKEAAATRPADDPVLLKADIENLRAQLQDLRVRDQRISEELSNSQFVRRQQDIQIKDLALAPVQRDEYKKQVEDLTEQVQRLRARLKELSPNDPLVQPTPTPAPATAPSAPATAPSTLPASTTQAAATAPVAVIIPLPSSECTATSGPSTFASGGNVRLLLDSDMEPSTKPASAPSATLPRGTLRAD